MCRVESAHSILKRLLQNSMSDFCGAWNAINNMLILQHIEIKASFEHSILIVIDNYNSRLYMQL